MEDVTNKMIFDGYKSLSDKIDELIEHVDLQDTLIKIVKEKIKFLENQNKEEEVSSKEELMEQFCLNAGDFFEEEELSCDEIMTTCQYLLLGCIYAFKLEDDELQRVFDQIRKNYKTIKKKKFCQ